MGIFSSCISAPKEPVSVLSPRVEGQGSPKASGSRPSVAGYTPRSAGLVSPADYSTGEFGWWSSVCKPSGHVDYRRELAWMPMAYRPVSGFYVAFRKGSPLEKTLTRVFSDLGPGSLSQGAIDEVTLKGRRPERFSALLTLIHCGQFNARFSSPIFVDTANGRFEEHVNLIHRIAIFGREPEPGSEGLSLKDRFQGLREAGESLNSVNRERWTPLHFAARYDNAQTVAALIRRKVNLNAQNKQGFTPLMLAAKHGSPEVVAMLLATQAERDRRSLSGQLSALHLAVGRGGPQGRDIARMLIENGAQPGIQDSKSRTPLHIAVLRRDEAMAATLLAGCPGRRAARPNWADCQGETALHIASRLGLETVVRRLLDAGAHPNLADLNDRTPLASAYQAGAPGAVVRLLEEKGAIVNATL